MNLVPVTSGRTTPSVWTTNGRAMIKAGRDIEAAEIMAWTKGELERQRTTVINDVAVYQLMLELGLLEIGNRLAGNSPAAQLLVARKVATFCECNNQRLTELFGGLS